MAQFKLRALGAITAAVLLISCQPADFAPEIANNASDLTEFYGGGRLQLSPHTMGALAVFLLERREGLFAASRRSGNHAHFFCDREDCSADDALRVIDQCSRMTAIARRTCGLLIFGQQVVWQGEVVYPFGRLALLEDHNRRFRQILAIEIPGQSERIVTTLYIDESHPTGIFTVQPDRFGGFCQGTYDFLSLESGIWDLRCIDGYEVLGTFHSEELPKGGFGSGMDNHDKEVRLLLLPRIGALRASMVQG